MRYKFRRGFESQIRLVLLLVIFSAIFGITFYTYKFLIYFNQRTGLTPWSIINLVINGSENLKSSANRTNILVLGISGGNTAPTDLTDSMIVISIGLEGQDAAVIPIPRDVWSDNLKDKINTAYHYGEIKKPNGGGMVLAKYEAENLLGIPVHYAAVIDFSGFQKIVDSMGGLDLIVSAGFIDTKYPIAGRENDDCGGDREFNCRYKTISFKTGQQYMDGQRALEYVRSRHAQGSEGSDFARSRRQQEIISAVRNKLVNVRQLFRLKQNLDLWHEFRETVKTDMTVSELISAGELYVLNKPKKIISVSLERYFWSPPDYLYGNRYVLVTINEAGEFKKMVSKILN